MSAAAFRRLGSAWVLALLPGIGVAFPLAIGTLFVTGLMAGAGYDLVLPATAITHGLFIALLADGVERRRLRIRPRAIAAGAALGIIIWGFACLDNLGSSFQCADGKILGRSDIPMLPWGWIGWFLLALYAIPSRLLGHSRDRLEQWPDRMTMLAPFAAIILVVGLPFQRHRIDCDSMSISYGLFDGGLIAIPMLGLFLFSMAFSLAVLSAAYVRPTREVSEE